jgi:hypothetical protein
VSESTTTSLKALIRFPFQDRDWQSRFIIGSGLTLAGFFVPLVPLVFVYGYVLQIVLQAVKGEDLRLPAWDDWGRLATDGLRLLAVGLVYLLPGLLVLICGFVLYFVGVFATTLPASSQAASTASPVPMLLGMGTLFLSYFKGFLLLSGGSILLAVAAPHFAIHDQVAAAFRVRQWWPILWGNKLGYFVAWALFAGVWSILSYVTALAYYSVVLCCFVPIVAAPIGFYVSLVGAAVFGQTYRESTAILAARSVPAVP